MASFVAVQVELDIQVVGILAEARHIQAWAMHKLVVGRLMADRIGPRHTLAAEMEDKQDFGPDKRAAPDLVREVHHVHGYSCLDLDFELQMRNCTVQLQSRHSGGC